MALVELDRVEKRYGELRALKEVSLTLEPGRIGLLGPNGAGKSTLLKTMLGLIPFDSGSVKVFDLDVAREPFAVRSLDIAYGHHMGIVAAEKRLHVAGTHAVEADTPHGDSITRRHRAGKSKRRGRDDIWRGNQRGGAFQKSTP